MLIFLLMMLSALLILMGIYMVRKDSKEGRCDGSGAMWIVIGGGIIVILFMFWGARYSENVSNIEKFKAAREDARRAHEPGCTGLERATILAPMTDYNAWLAKAKYWNDTFVGGWTVPDRIKYLEPIK